MSNFYTQRKTIFRGIDFTGVLAAILLNQNGTPVTIELPEIPSCHFIPELSCINPSSAKQIVSSYINYRFLLKCSSLCPHHFYPRKVLWLHDKAAPQKTLQLFDTLSDREREGCYLPVNLKKTQDFNKLASLFGAATLVTEHRFDANQAIIDLLLKARQQGVKIIVQPEKTISSVLRFIQNTKHAQIIIEHAWSYPNDIRYSNKNYTATLQAIENNTVLHIYRHNPHISPEALQHEVSLLLSKLQVPIPDKIPTIVQALFRPVENRIEKTSVNTLRKSFGRIKKELRKSGIVLPSASKLFSEHRQNQVTQAKFRELQSICDEKFDLAKQSNIEYQHFARLYYRYPGEIDNMIEKAYDMMNTTRNGKKIWEQIETMHLENIKSNFTLK
ncbi:MAG: hypothetical protein JXR50_11585 [Prolixibacteraceae bacterium]|nr:hypothetical protein [Prolixibacteraceae bacterium]MBN2650371.1 hypothetical protein [Prolixibacteraceae bacterium]